MNIHVSMGKNGLVKNNRTTIRVGLDVEDESKLIMKALNTTYKI
jgi:hypothetical protein